MSSALERFEATVSHVPHPHLLFYADFTPELRQRVFDAYGVGSMDDLASLTGMWRPVWVYPDRPENLPSPDFSAYYDDVDIPEGARIDENGVLHLPGSMHHFTRMVSPLRNASSFEEIESYPYPSLEGWSYESMEEKVKRAHEEGRVAVTLVGHIYETAWQIRGYEEFLMDMVERPEWCEYILDRVMLGRALPLAVAAARAGVDMIHTGDDVANQRGLMFSVDMWRRFIKSRWEKVYAAAREIKPDIQVRYHSDGDVEPILDELVEIGVTILNPVQPECMDARRVKERYGKDLVIDGAVGTQTTMPFASPEEVGDTIRRLKREIGYDGGWIIAPTHVLEPDVPLDNVKAFFDAASEPLRD